MKLYVSVDLEGIAGIVHWDQIMSGGSDYQQGRRLVSGELASLCRGAAIGGAGEIVVNDCALYDAEY